MYECIYIVYYASMIRFPSLESYMSVVVLGHICLSAGSLWMILGSVALTFLIGFSRVYSQVGTTIYECSYVFM